MSAISVNIVKPLKTIGYFMYEGVLISP